MGFEWGSCLQWPAVFKLEGRVFKLEGVLFTMSLEGVCLPDFHHFSVLVVREAEKAKDTVQHPEQVEPCTDCPFTSEISVKREHGILIPVMRYFYFLIFVIRA